MTPCPVALQTLLSVGFLRQEYWSWLPFPSPGDLPQPGVESVFPALVDGFLTIEPSGKPTPTSTAIYISLGTHLRIHLKLYRHTYKHVATQVQRYIDTHPPLATHTPHLYVHTYTHAYMYTCNSTCRYTTERVYQS